MRPTSPPELGSNTARLATPMPLQDFVLVDHRGQNFTPAQLKGHWSYLFFGYMNCPDICPTTLTTLNHVARRIALLPDTPPSPQYVFVSVDPARDTQDRLAEFVHYFNPEFIGVTGTPAALSAFAGQLGIVYLKDDAESAADYLIHHSAAILLIDPQGRLYAQISPPFDPDSMAKDLSAINDHWINGVRLD